MRTFLILASNAFVYFVLVLKALSGIMPLDRFEVA